MKDVRRIAICNERFLMRFGVDRILVLLAEHLARCGHQITFICLRADLDRLRAISEHIEILAAPTQANLLGFDALVSSELMTRLRPAGYDAIIIGGWPFFQTAALASSLGICSVFIDAGAVPHDGFPDDALPIQREVRRLREMTLPAIGLITPISRFIEESQTLPDRGCSDSVVTVHLGADHMSRSLPIPLDESEASLLGRLDELRSADTHLILALGRMERFGYKNSHAVFDLLRSIRDVRSDIRLVILTGPDSFDVPEDLRASVIVLSTISDAALQGVMQRCAVGVSPSLWEGFNLPVAEMQWLGRPALAFNVGAHPEIIADPWFLCQSQAEMVVKALEIITNGVPAAIASLSRLEAFRQRFTWDATLARWAELIMDLRLRSPPKDPRRIVIADVSNSARDPANSGVIRVTRRLTAELNKRSDLILLFAKWDGVTGDYALLCGADHDFLGSNSGPTDWIGQAGEALHGQRTLAAVLHSLAPWSASKPVLLLPEVILDGTAENRVSWARANQCAAAFIFYDMLPVFAAHFVSEDVTAAFPSYLAALGASDAMLAISQFSLSEYERWKGAHDTILPRRRKTVWLPAQFSDRPRVKGGRTPGRDPVELLCVSTIEPRKNHAVLIEAFTKLLRRAETPLRLNLVGNSYAGENGLSDWIRSVCAAEPSIVWHGIVDDGMLEELYSRARFTIYPSLTEGFGLPIVESLWMGCPILCYSGGVMSELAATGGCLTVDMTSVADLESGMAKLLADDRLCDQLSREACARDLADWHDYGDMIAGQLVSLATR